jgi:hypothetical protein
MSNKGSRWTVADDDARSDVRERVYVTHSPETSTPGVTSMTGSVQPYVGASAATAAALQRSAPPRFVDVDDRARRLLEWAREESRYVRSHDVAVFSDADVMGRTGYANEGLYELLPDLLSDCARLRAACGRGPMWAATRQLCDEAARAVQSYFQVWEQLKREHAR